MAIGIACASAIRDGLGPPTFETRYATELANANIHFRSN